MNRAERRYERAASAAVVAVFTALWVIAFGLGEPPEFKSQYVFSAVVVAMVAATWVIAVRLLLRAWFARASRRHSTADGAARLLAAAVAALPRDLRDWGRAMEAELLHVEDRASRWWFAAGCARTAMFPPGIGGIRVIAVAALAAAAVAVAGPVVGQAVPGLRVFAVTFVALAGSLATLAAARSRALRGRMPGPTIALAGVAGVAACIAVTAHFLIEHPEAAEHLPPLAAATLAVVLTGCLWLALAPPRGLTSSRLARGFGAGAALALGLGFLVTSRWSVHTHGGPFIWIVFAPAAIFLAASAAAAAIGRSFRAGVETAVWTALAGTLLVFSISLPEAMRRYAIDGCTLGDGESGYPIGVNIVDAVWVLVVIPLLGLPFGVMGAAAGRRLHGRPSHPSSLAENPR